MSIQNTKYKIQYHIQYKIQYHTKCVSLSNQKCEIQPALINLDPNDYNQEIHYYAFAVKLDSFVGSFNTLNDLC